MQEKKFNKGEVIIRQGDYGESFFQIVEGSVDVYVDYQGANEKKLSERDFRKGNQHLLPGRTGKNH